MSEAQLRRLLSAIMAATATLVSVIAATQAEPVRDPSRADVTAMRHANEVCQPVQAADLDGQWIPCLVGEFQARRPGRYVSEDFLAIRDGKAVLTRGSVRVRLR